MEQSSYTGDEFHFGSYYFFSFLDVPLTTVLIQLKTNLRESLMKPNMFKSHSLNWLFKIRYNGLSSSIANNSL